MKITITGKPKEIAALAVETQRRQWNVCREMMADKSSEAYEAMVKAVHVLRELKPEEMTTGKLAVGCRLTAEKLGDPAASGNKIEQFFRSKDRTSADPDSDSEERPAL